MEQSKLNEILKNHKKWLNKDNGVRADFRGLDLQFADFRNTDLRYADFRGANLEHADFRNADLRYANFRGTDLQFADFRGVKASYAEFGRANLIHADLRYANASYADLNYANVQYANLQQTKLQETDLRWINWNEVKGIRIYVAGLQSHIENEQLTYIPRANIATIGRTQGTWNDLKEFVTNKYKTDNPTIYHKYQLAFDYIDAQIKVDKDRK